jgi:hypothetical protein
MTLTRILKAKECRQCGITYTPSKHMQAVCTFECAIAHSRAKREQLQARQARDAHKSDRAKHKADKLKIKTRGQWVKEVQTQFNMYIRARDHDQPCISCQRFHTGQYHAGHYLTTGAHPELRFNEINCHKQCAPCNNHLSGNVGLYRENLISKIGVNLVEWLEGEHKPVKPTIDELKWLKQYYSQQAREAKKALM